ncbi:MAG TPA: SigE family RNA polymerase sigma factor [Acidimicrobiales bacterium]|nr:SigE family RNA polymerase sigma factor [Acidimicrobiales bacterium]
MGFESFYQETYSNLVRLAYLVTLDREAAAEVAQETLMSAWRRWDTLCDQNPGGWVRTVALNKCRSRWRRYRTEITSRWKVVGPVADSSSPADLDLIAALRDLPTRQREAVVLHYWGDLSVDQCASVMGASPGAVKQHLARARARLASTLATNDEDPSNAVNR